MEIEPKPYFVSTTQGQMRYWMIGQGTPLLVLPGLVLSPSERARRIAQLALGYRVVAFELPGIGASTSNEDLTLDGLSRQIAEAAGLIGVATGAIVSFDLTNGLASKLAEELGTGLERTILVANPYLTHHGAKLRVQFDKVQTGSHLIDLWALIRDANMFMPGPSQQVAAEGEDLPDPEVLDRTVVAAAANPSAYAALWNMGVENASPHDPVDWRDLPARLKILPAAPRDLPKAAIHVKPSLPEPMRRDYVDIPSGRVHIRRAGAGRPVVVLQAAPGSASHLNPVTLGLSRDFEAIAPDYIGNGESSKPRNGVSVESMARDVLDLADALNINQFDLWGTHTGANVAIEASLQAPQRIGRMVLEAPIMLDANLTQEILENYFQPVQPNRWGTHLIEAWNFRRDLSLFWPWYRQDRTAARQVGVPNLNLLHEQTLGLLQSGLTYQLTYRAAFSYPTAEKVPMISRPTLICAAPCDVLYESLAKATLVAPDCCKIAESAAVVHYPYQDPAAVAETLQLYIGFLKGWA